MPQPKEESHLRGHYEPGMGYSVITDSISRWSMQWKRTSNQRGFWGGGGCVWGGVGSVFGDSLSVLSIWTSRVHFKNPGEPRLPREAGPVGTGLTSWL